MQVLGDLEGIAQSILKNQGSGSSGHPLRRRRTMAARRDPARPPRTEYQNSKATNTTSRSEGGGGWSAPLLSAAGREGAPTHPRRAEQRYRRTTRRRGRRSRPRDRGAEPTEPSEARMFEGGEGARQGAGREPRAPRRGAHYPMQTQSARRLARRMVCVRLCACGQLYSLRALKQGQCFLLL